MAASRPQAMGSAIAMSAALAAGLGGCGTERTQRTATAPESTRRDASPAAGGPAAIQADARPADPEIAITDRPIRFDAERIRLALEYRRIHSDPAADDIDITPRVIVIHHTGGRSADASWRYFNRTRIEQARAKLADAGAVNVAAHFLVDRDGTVFRLIPETRMGRHAIGLNHIAIGIENVGDGDRHPLTEAQLAANAALVRHLARRFPITHVVGHHETPQLEGHEYFVERSAGYRNRKPDPGPAFMTRLRAAIADLGLLGPPG